MKAYIVSDRNCDSGTALVVFAETAGKAKAYAAMTDELCDFGFTGIRAKRCKELDGYYKGRSEMDWLDEEDRKAMVRLAGFFCSYEINDPVCDECAAAEWCARREIERFETLKGGE